MEAKKNIVLSIGLLVSNRRDTINRCLDSLTPIREAIPSELIILDTGCDQDLHDMLVEYADKIECFTWCRDFSKARNVTLDLAEGEWYMFIDDDEWVEDPQPFIDFFKSGEYHSFTHGCYVQRNYQDIHLIHYSDFNVSRLIQIEEETHFESKIHEYLAPVHGPCKMLNGIVGHTGYIFQTEEDKQKHYERNSVLLLNMIEEEPENLRWHAHLAQEYRFGKKWKEQEEFCLATLESTKNRSDAHSVRNIMTIYAGYIQALIKLEKNREVIDACVDLLKDERCTNLAVVMVYHSLAEACYNLGRYEKSIESCEQYLKAKQEYESYEEFKNSAAKPLILHSSLDDVQVKRVYSIMICADLKRGSTENLYKYYDQLEWDKKTQYVFEDIDMQMAEALIKNQDAKMLRRLLEDTYDTQYIRARIRDRIKEWKEIDESQYQVANEVYEEVDNQKVESLFEGIENVLAIPENIYFQAAERHIKITKKWHNVPAEKWIHDAREYAFVAYGEHQILTEENLKTAFEEEDWRYRFYYLSKLEASIAKGIKDLSNVEAYHTSLVEYVNALSDFCSRYYEDAFYQESQIVQYNVRGGEKLLEFLELESSDKIHALSKLKEAIEICPQFTEALRKFISHYPDLEQERARKQQEEMNALRNQVLAQANAMLEGGQVQEAISVLHQLAQIMPNDLEIQSLILQAQMKVED